MNKSFWVVPLYLTMMLYVAAFHSEIYFSWIVGFVCGFFIAVLGYRLDSQSIEEKSNG